MLISVTEVNPRPLVLIAGGEPGSPSAPTRSAGLCCLTEVSPDGSLLPTRSSSTQQGVDLTAFQSLADSASLLGGVGSGLGFAGSMGSFETVQRPLHQDPRPAPGALDDDRRRV